MAWFHSNTLFVSVSLFCLPVLVLCAILCLPLLIFIVGNKRITIEHTRILTFLKKVGLYFFAWLTYYFMAQTDAGFNLPYNPTRVIKINIATFGIIFGWITYLPIIISYLYWRYWEIGTRRFKEIVRCV